MRTTGLGTWAAAFNRHVVPTTLGWPTLCHTIGAAICLCCTDKPVGCRVSAGSSISRLCLGSLMVPYPQPVGDIRIVAQPLEAPIGG